MVRWEFTVCSSFQCLELVIFNILHTLMWWMLAQLWHTRIHFPRKSFRQTPNWMWWMFVLALMIFYKKGGTFCSVRFGMPHAIFHFPSTILWNSPVNNFVWTFSSLIKFAMVCSARHLQLSNSIAICRSTLPGGIKRNAYCTLTHTHTRMHHKAYHGPVRC